MRRSASLSSSPSASSSCEREQKLRDHGARVVVEPAEEAEVEQGEPPSSVRRTLPRCGSAW